MLGADQAQAFEAEYARRLREAYAKMAYGTIFPFKRIFWVATRS
jgi:trans-aconitate 2-methyltransferase